MKKCSRSLAIILGLLTCGYFSFAQVPTGTPPFGSFTGAPDVINLANLNAHFTLPILHKAGRGSDFAYNLTYDTSVWYPTNVNGTTIWQPTTNWGWLAPIDAKLGKVTYSESYTTCIATGGTQIGYNSYSNFAYVSPYGQISPFPGSFVVSNANGTPPGCPYGQGSASLNSSASDGSGLKLSLTATYSNSITSQQLTMTQGSIVDPYLGLSGKSTDRNGNQITLNSSGQYFDTMSALVPVLTFSGAGTPASPYTLAYTAPSGASASYKIKFTSYNVQTNFGCSGVTEYGANGTTTANLVSEIDLPDQGIAPTSRYTFSYESTPGKSGYVTGRLASITLPTGGTISYTYAGGSSGHITCSDGSTSGLQRVTPDTGANHWTYTRAAGSGAAYTTTVTDPLGNITTIQFQGLYETQRVVKDSGGTTLSTINTCYNGASSPCTGTAVTLPITQRVVSNQIGSSGPKSSQKQQYNAYGLPTSEIDYDFPSGTTALKSTWINYATLGNGIVSMPLTVSVCSGTGTNSYCGGIGSLVSQTSYQYDGASLTTTSSPQHVSVTGARANATSVSYLLGLTYLSKTFTYFDTGMVNTATDLNLGVTTYQYQDATSTCGNTFPTKIVEAVTTLSQSFTWNCTGGVQASVTDENGQITNTAWSDPYYWRPASTTDPANNATTFYYQPNSSYSTPWSVASFLTFNSSSSQASDISYLDGLGRVYVKQRAQSPGASMADTVSYKFDANGRLSSTSMPCSVGLSSTCPATPVTAQTYDALDRPLVTTDGGGGTTTYTYLNTTNDTILQLGPTPTGENPKKRQFEYDGLGRVTSVCEVSTSLTGYGACGQQNPQSGFLTKYIYNALGQITNVSQNAQTGGSAQTRSYSYDGLGRLTSETNPETGTTNYTYDSDTTCGSSTGDLVKKVDAVGNVTCMAYDALHRLTATTYPSGSYAAVTPAKHFVYDSATVNSVAMVYAQGRLAEAYTCTGSCTSKTTDEGFSYTKRGEPSDLYQSNPSSSGFYHVAQTYWANGVANTLSGIPGLPTITYNVDGEGRTKTASASTGQNPLTATGYNYASLPTSVTFGSGDSDGFTYDSNTNRMTKYQFNVNGQTETGQLTWNQMGTLGGLQIIDPFNSTDNGQNCTYSHDDLVRTSGVNCGSLWTQQFTYDAYGNITKSGTGAFASTYTSNNNRITTIASFAPTYDANGNLLQDTYNTYTWDSDGNLVSTVGKTVTYDAFDRMVAFSNGQTILYAPSGGPPLADNTGQTLGTAYLHLPGNAVVVYNSSGIYQYNHPDWLGSARLFSTQTRSAYPGYAYAPFGEGYARDSSGWVQFTADGNVLTANYGSNMGGTLDDFMFRRYSPSQGRWISPDPAGTVAVDPANPQSWNRYAYVLNNPLGYVDPLGLSCVDGNGNTMKDENGQEIAESGCDSAGGTWVPPAPTTTITVTAPPDDSGNSAFQWFSDFADSFASMNGSQISISLNRCAAQKTNKIYSKVLGSNSVVNAVAGNSFSSLSQALLGPNRGTGIASTLVSGPQEQNLTNAALKITGSIPVLKGTVISAVPGTEIELGGKQYFATMVERYTAQTLKDLPVAGKVLSRAASVLDGKVLLDGVVYIGAEVSCAVP